MFTIILLHFKQVTAHDVIFKLTNTEKPWKNRSHPHSITLQLDFFWSCLSLAEVQVFGWPKISTRMFCVWRHPISKGTRLDTNIVGGANDSEYFDLQLRWQAFFLPSSFFISSSVIGSHMQTTNPPRLHHHLPDVAPKSWTTSHPSRSSSDTAACHRRLSVGSAIVLYGVGPEGIRDCSRRTDESELVPTRSPRSWQRASCAPPLRNPYSLFQNWIRWRLLDIVDWDGLGPLFPLVIDFFRELVLFLQNERIWICSWLRNCPRRLIYCNITPLQRPLIQMWAFALQEEVQEIIFFFSMYPACLQKVACLKLEKIPSFEIDLPVPKEWFHSLPKDIQPGIRSIAGWTPHEIRLAFWEGGEVIWSNEV